MRRLPSGLGGLGGLGGLPTGDGPAAKRQKRSDILDSLGGLSTPSAFGKRGAGSSAQGAGRSTPTGGGGGVGGFGKSASAADMEAMKAWLTDAEGDSAASKKGSEAIKAASGVPSKGVDARAPEPVAAVAAADAAAPATTPSAEACADSAGTPAAASSAQAGSPPDDSMTPFVLTSESAKEWCGIFVTAKDRWDIVDAETGRGVFWHTESGTCFEWEQSVGILFQYGEEDVQGKPQKFPIWSLDCPEQSAWIWDTLPLPPTDPAARGEQPDIEAPEKQAEADAKVEAKDEGEKAAPVVATASGDMAPPPVPLKQPASARPDSSMLPPPVPFKKKPAPPVPAFKCQALNPLEDDDDDDDHAFHTEVLDDNVWERRCRALEQRKNAAAGAAPASSSSASGARSASEGIAGVAAALAAAGAAALGGGDEVVSIPTVAGPPLGPRGPLDDDSDDDAPAAGPLAAEGPAPALPSAPVPAKPKACDLELDMFGDPVVD